MVHRIWGKKAFAAAVAGSLFLAGAIGAAAATGGGGPLSPVNDALSQVGLAATDSHGAHVSTAVHEAIASSTASAGRGAAVSAAACEAAHDRTTLPETAKQKDPKPCKTTEAEDTGTEDEDSGASLEPLTQDENHGAAVSQAVHNAIASTTPGPERGIAVSEAACEAAHDRTTLPDGAQNAPGQAAKAEDETKVKDCTHPNDAEADTAGTEDAETGHGNPNAQGQQHGKSQEHKPADK